MNPTQLSTQCVDNLSVREGLGKADHVEKVWAAESATVLAGQLSTQCVDNLLTVSGSLVRENVLANILVRRAGIEPARPVRDKGF